MSRCRWIIAALLFLLRQTDAGLLRIPISIDGTGSDTSSFRRIELLVPEPLSTADSTVTLIVHFHGSSGIADQFLDGAPDATVALAIHLGSFSTPYREYFSRHGAFQHLLDSVRTHLAGLSHRAYVRFNHVVIASFSAGYAAVREVLRVPRDYDRVQAIILADGLHASSDSLEMEEQMGGFLRFAGDALVCRKIMSITHSAIVTDGYESTTSTADYLLAHLGLHRSVIADSDMVGYCTSRVDTGCFSLRGYTGDDAAAHMHHFHGLPRRVALVLQQLGQYGDSVIPEQAQTSPFAESESTFAYDPDVRIRINAPSVLDPWKPVSLILYALPNGNTIEWTAGKRVFPGDDWHYGIQHIAAQTRRLREVVDDRNIVIVYLETKGLSWPQWRRTHAEAGKIIADIVDSLGSLFPSFPVKVTLTGHSGGGSFTFGYINAVDSIPGSVDRIAFLDSNYGYNKEEGHGRKLAAWLAGDDSRALSVIAYDDRKITLDGKRVVGPDGGTFRATDRMLPALHTVAPLHAISDAVHIHIRNDAGTIDILVHRNPSNLILHTNLVGPMNGFLHAMTVGSPYEGRAAQFDGPPAYEQWIGG